MNINKSKIKDSVVVSGSNNEILKPKKTSNIKTVLITIITTVIAGIALLIIEYYFSVLGIFS